MNLFFESLTTNHKIKTHYHHFLLSLYSLVFNRIESRRIHLDSSAFDHPSSTNSSIGTLPPRHDHLRNKALLEGWRTVFAGGSDPRDPVINGPDYVLAQVARDLIVKEGYILAFDEIQMVDVAGAGILSRVLEWYWRLGGIILGTSNRIPEHMYDEGVQKSTVLPFLNRLKDKSPTIQLDSNTDWRRELTHETKSTSEINSSWYLASISEKLWSERVKEFLPEEEQTELLIYGRKIEIKRANLKTRSILITYKELCETPLGPADYLLIASTFENILVDHLPVFTGLMKNEARRFITFLDACYECQVKLYINAAAEIDELFFPDHTLNLSSHEENDPIRSESMSEIIQDLISSPRPNISSYGPSNPLPSFSSGSGVRHETLAIFTGQDEQYAFQRAVSRLHELTRPGGSGKAWVPMLDMLNRLWQKKNDLNEIPTSDWDATVIDKAEVDPQPQLRRPIISPNNIWGIGKWGKRAGRWGQGVDAYEKK
ncbi:AFG1-like ATPase-domain-containing protein [Melampsora americana]|nr:AFG1-like ATPase-domain-containing protein [Melampsora americana]